MTSPGYQTFVLLGVCIVMGASPDAVGVRRMHYDLATLQGEALFGAGRADSALRSDDRLQTWWLYASMQAFTIAGRPLFLSIEADGMRRTVETNRAAFTGGIGQRYGFFVGYPVVKLTGSTGTLMAGAGLAGTFNVLIRENGYVHLIYDHRFKGSETFSWGLGILFKHRFGRFIAWPNLLFSMDWTITPTTYLKAAWDVLELRQYLTRDLSLVAEARYDLHFFAFDNRAGYTLETAGLGGGVDWMLTKNLALRLRYKKMLFNHEEVRFADGSVIDVKGTEGQSVKVGLAYGR